MSTDRPTHVDHSRRGQEVDAEAKRPDVLVHEPGSPNDLYLLGLHERGRGNYGEAERLLGAAVRSSPETLRYHDELVALTLSRGAYDRAAAALVARLRQDPADAASWNNLGACRERLGEPSLGRTSYRRAVTVDPALGEAAHNLAILAFGNDAVAGSGKWARRSLACRQGWVAPLITLGHALGRLRRDAEALRAYRAALALAPGQAPGAWNGAAARLRSLGRGSDAVNAARRAMAWDATDWETLANLSELLRQEDRLDEACLTARRAIALRPGAASGIRNMALIVADLDRGEDPLQLLRRALIVSVGDVEVRLTFAIMLKQYGRFDDCVSELHAVLRERPDDAVAHLSLSYALMCTGHLQPAWEEYEWRFKLLPVTSVRSFPMPFWTGEPLSGKLLAWTEQGVAHDIRTFGLVPDLVRRGISVVLECDPRLVESARRSFRGVEVVPRTNPPDVRLASDDIEAQVSTESLPRWFRPDLDAFPKVPFIVPDSDRVDYWRRRLAEVGAGPTIGIAWRSRLGGAAARRTYAGLHEWGPIFALPGRSFVRLQYDDCAAELEWARHQFGVTIHDFPEIDLFNDLDDSFALAACLDHVVSTATSVATIAGAVGVRTFILTHAADTLMLGSGTYPWFADARCFLRTDDGSWATAIAAVSRQLDAKP
jgi:Flp pilus assembly protein TadD